MTPEQAQRLQQIAWAAAAAGTTGGLTDDQTAQLSSSAQNVRDDDEGST